MIDPFLSKQISIQQTFKMVFHGSIKLWTESFGDSSDPPLLLLMGAGEPGIMWPTNFCQDLASQGHYIIRFDYRDVGKSSSVDYIKSPYTVMDLSHDTLAILDAYSIQKAHFVGFSMGGQISQFIGAYFPDRALSLTLIGTSSCFEELFNAFEGKIIKSKISYPNVDYVRWATRPIDPDLNLEQIKQYKLEHYRQLNNSSIPINEKMFKQFINEELERSDLNNPSINHGQAMIASYKTHRRALPKIYLPTLIIHGAMDPIFPLDHGQSLHKMIKNSHLKIIQEMGHCFNSPFFPEIINYITSHIFKV